MKQTSKKQYPEVKTTGKIDHEMKYYGNDPYFVKKVKESQAFLKEHGFPEELLKIRRGNI